MKPPFTISLKIEEYSVEDGIGDTRLIGEFILNRPEILGDAILRFGMHLLKLGLDIEEVNPIIIALFEEERKNEQNSTGQTS